MKLFLVLLLHLLLASTTFAQRNFRYWKEPISLSPPYYKYWAEGPCPKQGSSCSGTCLGSKNEVPIFTRLLAKLGVEREAVDSDRIDIPVRCDQCGYEIVFPRKKSSIPLKKN
jgi:hypothetical protein